MRALQAGKRCHRNISPALAGAPKQIVKMRSITVFYNNKLPYLAAECSLAELNPFTKALRDVEPDDAAVKNKPIKVVHRMHYG